MTKHSSAVQIAGPAPVEAFSFADTPRLTTALRAGDEAAFRWLYRQWNMRLFRYCFALAAGDDALASEITQATYLRAARHLRVLADETALWNWLARAARNAACDLHRKGGRYRGALNRFAQWLGSQILSETAPQAPADDDHLAASLEAALDRLEADERALIEHRYFQPEPLEQIATRLGCSARAVEGRLARLREKLRRLIAEELQRVE